MTDLNEKALEAANVLSRRRAAHIEALEAEVTRLREALREAAETLEWASRRMKGNCSGADVNAVILAARQAREGGNALALLRRRNHEQ